MYGMIFLDSLRLFSGQYMIKVFSGQYMIKYDNFFTKFLSSQAND